MSERAALTKTSEKKAKESVSTKPKENHSQSKKSPVEQILHLQRTIGNQAVQRLIKNGTLQAKPPVHQITPLNASVLQRQHAPTRLIVRRNLSTGYPQRNERSLDAAIGRRQRQPYGRGTRLGTVTYVNVPNASTRQATIRRCAVKHAILDIIISNPPQWSNSQIHVRVPLQPTHVLRNRQYGMIILRFDRNRNVEATYSGTDSQTPSFTSSIAPATRAQLQNLTTNFGITFVTNNITTTLSGRRVTLPGKAWGANDIGLLTQALQRIGARERAIIRGVNFRRLNLGNYRGIAGFFTTQDNSINLMDAALPTGRGIWFGGGRGGFVSAGVFTALHEISHALEGARPPRPRGARRRRTRRYRVLFKNTVLAEARRRHRQARRPIPRNIRRRFPPPMINLPTRYSRNSWSEFFAETYSIFRLNPGFLRNTEYQYLFNFFNTNFP